MPRIKRPPNRPSPRPAHLTKDQPILSYPFLSTTFQLKQLDDGQSNGTGLWLGSQCLSLYLAENEAALLKAVKTRRKALGLDLEKSPPRAIELGSGIGLGALALAFAGWDVLATDVALIRDTVLSANVSGNIARMTEEGSSGRAVAKELNWSVPPSDWSWTNAQSVTTANPINDDVESIAPPFDLIITSDTIFSAELAPHLLRTINHICKISEVSDPHKSTTSYPLVYVAIENRDPRLVTKTLEEASTVWNFDVSRIPHAKVSVALRKGGVDWEPEEWEGVEIWKFDYRG